MATKLTVYIDESLKRLIKETSGNRKVSEVVNEALWSYVASGSIASPHLGGAPPRVEFPSLSEVKSRRPKASGSSSEIIAAQRRGRHARIS